MIKLPLLEHIKSQHTSVSLQNVLIVGCQHILATTHTLIRSLYDLGLDPRNVFLLGKCYSTNHAVWQEMRNEGIQVSSLSFSFDSQQAFDDQFLALATQFLKETLAEVDLSKFNKIILMDDGGQLLSLATELFKDCKNAIGIEQTTSGYEKIKHLALPFPVINVARSHAKLVYESPLIAEAVVEKALKHLDLLKHVPSKVLIIGNGAIGSALYSAIKNDYDVVQIYDQNPSNKMMRKVHFDLDEQLRTADLIIGCTGTTSISANKHNLLKKGCVLLSASSSDREFDTVHFRKNCANIQSCHDDVESDGVIILNGGFPVNFDGGRHSVTPSKIQLTRALLMAAVFQGCNSTNGCSCEIISLDEDVQANLIRKFLELRRLKTKARARFYPRASKTRPQLVY